MYTDFDFYTNTYYGSLISADDFSALERQAALFVDRLSFNRLNSRWPITDKVRMAVCAVAEAIKRHEDAIQLAASSAGFKSENNDGYSVTYQDPDVLQAQLLRAQTDAARPYLIYTGLMDRSF